MNDWLVIVNPNAGIGRAKKDWAHISGLLNRRGFDYLIRFTEGPMHAIELVSEYIEKGFRKIIVVGGDGTMNEVVNGIFKQQTVPTTEISLGMISVGTGNDWGRTFNIPQNYEKAVAVLKNEHTMLQDAGTVSYFNSEEKKERFFINMAGLGFDGLVAQKTNADKVKGKSNPFLYLANLMSSLFTFKSCGTRVVVDDQEVKDKIFSISIGIGQYNGGGMRQAPDAKPDDGLFDITLIKAMTKLSVIANVNRLYNGTIKKHKNVEGLTGKKVIIESDQPVLLETDGESLGHSPFEFNIVPQSIRVIV
jgi:YegS/Rv2252/BmrU family lipid kinase